MKKVSWYNSTAIIISVMAFSIVWMATPAITLTAQSIPQVVYQSSALVEAAETVDPDICGLSNVECDDYITAKVTGFSSIECKTEWCQANAGKPRGHKVALNKKFGSVKQVYIPMYDKTYDVIGTTDYKTDLDIWFGDDHQTALEQSTKYLEIKLIR